jgi:hypothetical protein
VLTGDDYSRPAGAHGGTEHGEGWQAGAVGVRESESVSACAGALPEETTDSTEIEDEDV